MKLLKKEDAMKILAIIAITLATITGGILIRHDLGFGGRVDFPDARGHLFLPELRNRR